MPRSSDQLLRLSAAPQMCDLIPQVDAHAPCPDDRIREASSRDAVLDGLVSDAPLTSYVGWCSEAAGFVDRSQCGLDGRWLWVLGHGSEDTTGSCLTTTRRVASIQPMTTSQMNSLLQTRTDTRSRATSALLADAEYAEIRNSIQSLPADRSDRTDAQQAALADLIARKYEIADRIAA